MGPPSKSFHSKNIIFGKILHSPPPLKKNMFFILHTELWYLFYSLTTFRSRDIQIVTSKQSAASAAAATALANEFGSSVSKDDGRGRDVVELQPVPAVVPAVIPAVVPAVIPAVVPAVVPTEPAVNIPPTAEPASRQQRPQQRPQQQQQKHQPQPRDQQQKLATRARLVATARPNNSFLRPRTTTEAAAATAAAESSTAAVRDESVEETPILPLRNQPRQRIREPKVIAREKPFFTQDLGATGEEERSSSSSVTAGRSQSPLPAFPAVPLQNNLPLPTFDSLPAVEDVGEFDNQVPPFDGGRQNRLPIATTSSILSGPPLPSFSQNAPGPQSTAPSSQPGDGSFSGDLA